MSKHVFSGTYVVAAALMWTAGVRAEPPVRNGNLIPFYRDVRGPMCDPMNDAVGMITAITPLNTPLFAHNRGPSGTAPASCNRVLAPDGHQITLGEFKGVAGRASVNCVTKGTHTVLYFDGLQPNGIYTAWLFQVSPSPSSAYIAAGTLGVTAISENRFMASEAGEGQLSTTTPEQDLSAFGHVGSCFLEGVVELHLVYHIDQDTHGFLPGPADTWVVNARFLFP